MSLSILRSFLPIRIVFFLSVVLLLAQNGRAQQAERFDAGTVQLLGGTYYKHLQDLHEGSSGTLIWYEPDDLLWQFRNEVGITQPPGATDYTGTWEGDASNFGFVRGHTTGHYLSAASRMAALTGNATYLSRVNEVVAGLADVQDAFNDNGYLAAFPQSTFTTFETSGPHWPDAFVPYYTIHKIMAGLNDAHTYTGNQQALDVVLDMATYFVDRIDGLPQSTVEEMVKTHLNQGREFGGMNEVLTDLYVKADAASDPRAQSYLDLANVFNNRTYMNQLAAGNDVLDNTHANTHIPQAVGWARYADATGDPNALAAAQNYWDFAVRDHSFVTGGNAYGEWYDPPGVETGPDGSALSWSTAETCNVYNMLKLSAELFEQSPQQKYAAYAENALINHILPSIEPNNGTVTYFMALEPGRFKTYSTYRDHDGAFWCCVGSGMENPTRYADTAYFKGSDSLYVNTFMPTQVDWDEKGITLTQEGDSTTADETMHMTVNTTSGATPASVKVRIPSWAYGDVNVSINGQAYQGSVIRGEYLDLDRTWQDGDEVDITLDKKLYLRRSIDDPDMVSVYYGAVLLAGDLGTQDMPGNDQQAVDPADYSGWSVPAGLVPDIDAADADPETWLAPVPGEDLHFELYDNGVATGIIFKPFYETHHVRYSVYWKLNAPAGTRTWRGGGSYNTFKEGLNWDLAAAPDDSLVFDGDLTTDVENDYASGTSFGDLTFAPNAAAFTIGGNRMGLAGDVTNNSPNTQTVNAGLELAAGDHTFHTPGASLVVGGQVSGSGNLVKTGSSTLTLAYDNTYSGTTSIAGGELRIGDGGTAGSLGTGDITVASGATVAFDRADDNTFDRVVAGDGDLRKLGANVLTVIKPQEYTGQTIIEGGILRLDTGIASGGSFDLDFTTTGGSIYDAQGQGTGFTRRLAGTYDPTNDSNLDIDTANGKLWITSGGPADFNGDVNLQDIEAPGINLSDLGLNSDSDFTITANFQDVPDAANYRQYGVYVGDSAYRLIRGGYLTIDNHRIFGVNNASGTAADSGLSYTSTGAPSTGGDLDVTLSRTNGEFTLIVNGMDVTPTWQLSELNGLSDLTLGVFSMHTSSSSGDFTLPLTSFSVFSPDIPAGEVTTGQLPSATDVVFSAGATLDLNDIDQTVGSLAGPASSHILLGDSTGNTLTLSGATGTAQFDGVIEGQGDLVKSGGSTQVLGGQNSYTGTTLVTAGTLVVDGKTGLSQTNVASGATVAGGGVIQTGLTAQAGSTICVGVPGDALLDETLSVEGNLSLDATTQLLFDIASPTAHDQLVVDSSLSLSGILDVSLDPSASLTVGDTFEILTAAGGMSGTFTGELLPDLGSLLAMDVLYDTYTVTLTIIPALDGDFDVDGDVDGADFLLWQRGGSPDPLSSGDLALWQTNFGATTAALSTETSTAVPEPSTVVLLLVGLCGLLRGGFMRSGRALVPSSR